MFVGAEAFSFGDDNRLPSEPDVARFELVPPLCCKMSPEPPLVLGSGDPPPSVISADLKSNPTRFAACSTAGSAGEPEPRPILAVKTTSQEMTIRSCS